MRSRRQDDRPTVGDTLTVIHRVAVPDGALVQPRGPADTTLATLVGPPDVRREGDSVRIAYTIAVWAPGRHDLVLPGAVVVQGSGTIDTLPDAHVTLDVASVLPADAVAESLVPKAARPWVERASTSLLPLAVLLVPIALLLAALALWWRRRGPVVPPPPPAPRDAATDLVRIRHWLDAGESTLAVDHLAAILPPGPATEAWRERVHAVRFERDAGTRLDGLAREGVHLLEGQGGG